MATELLGCGGLSRTGAPGGLEHYRTTMAAVINGCTAAPAPSRD